MSQVLAAATRGGRFSHASRLAQSDSGAMLGVALGGLASMVGCGGALAAAVGAGASAGGGGAGGGGLRIKTLDVIPFAISGAIAVASPNVLFGKGGLAAALAGAPAGACSNHAATVVRKGSGGVLVNGRSLARQTEPTGCGAIVADGEKSVLVGGASCDTAPADPLAGIARGGALVAAGVGAALAEGREAIELASRWGEALVESGRREVEQVVARAEAGAAALEGALAAKVGALAAEARGGVLGSLVGGLFGGA